MAQINVEALMEELSKENKELNTQTGASQRMEIAQKLRQRSELLEAVHENVDKQIHGVYSKEIEEKITNMQQEINQVLAEAEEYKEEIKEANAMQTMLELKLATIRNHNELLSKYSKLCNNDQMEAD